MPEQKECWWKAEEDNLEPNVVTITSMEMAKYLLDKGFIQRSGCRFLTTPNIMKYIQERLNNE